MSIEFTVGDHVLKPSGYPFDSVVVAVFHKLDGQVRVVAESLAIPGLLHVFAPSQLDHVSSTLAAGRES